MAKFGFTDPAFHTPLQPPAQTQAAQTYPGGPQAGQAGLVPPPAEVLEGMYAAPAAGAVDTGRMTVEDTIHKTLGAFGVLLVGAVIGWGATAFVPSLGIVLMLVGAIGGLVLGLVNAFKRMPGAALVLGYAGLEGLFIGAFSQVMEYIYPGVVMQATIATVAVVGVTLALFANGKVRTSPRMNKIVLIAMGGMLLFSLINVGFMLFGGPFSDSAWGMRSGVEIAGIPLGVIIGVLAVFLGEYSLVMDFEFVQQGARNGAPRQLGWKAGFGIVSTVVWIYVEILRILAILRGND